MPAICILHYVAAKLHYFFRENKSLDFRSPTPKYPDKNHSTLKWVSSFMTTLKLTETRVEPSPCGVIITAFGS